MRLHPYPHVVIENCLPDDVYEELEKFYPKHEDIVQIAKPGRTSIAANTRVDLRASMVLSSKKQIVSKAWEEFIRYHSSREFYEEVIDLFGEEVFTKYHGKSREEKYGKKLREMEDEVRKEIERDANLLKARAKLDALKARPSSTQKIF